MNIRISVSGASRTSRAMKLQIGQKIQSIALDLYNGVKSRTPVRSGAAKRAWTYRKSAVGYTVSNNKPYIGPLDKGSSRQAPQGMTRPTIQEISRRKY